MVSKYYVVVCGVKPGIYTDWSTVESMVNGYPGAIFKSFHSLDEAKAFISKSNGSYPIPTESNSIPLIDKTSVYTDGKFSKHMYGFGINFVSNKGDKYEAYGKLPDNLIPNYPSDDAAKLYAIYVTLSLIKGDLVIYTSSKYVISALTKDIYEWISNGWNGVANRSLIEGTFKLMTNRNILLEYMDPNSIKYTNLASRLAEKGCSQSENLIVEKNKNRIV